MAFIQRFVIDPIVDPFIEPLTNLALILVSAMGASSYGPRVVEEVEVVIPKFEEVRIDDVSKFTNDLMLSPYWRVNRDKNGEYVIHARSEGEFFEHNSNSVYLFEKYLSDTAVESRKSVDLTTSIIFGSLPRNTVLIQSEKTYELPIINYGEGASRLNSFSHVAVEIGDEIFLIVKERGKDLSRSTLLSKIPTAINAVEFISALPNQYSTAEVYSEFYGDFFDLTDAPYELQRVAGLQGRDTFYGYFRSDIDIDYSGINIKISHPIYCTGEGTRKHTRLQKAECLGKPYCPGDLLFFLIEDNAVYLSSGEYNDRFGWFSGEETFEGRIEVLNIDEELLIESIGQFTGWQR